MLRELRKLMATIAVAGACVVQATALAQENGLPIDNQTVAVARLALDDPNKSVAMLDMLAAAVPQIAVEVKGWREQILKAGQAVRDAGGKELLVVYSLSDPFADQPFFVVPKGRELNPTVLARTFLGNGTLSPFHKPPALANRVVGGNAVIATSGVLSRLGRVKEAAVDELHAQLTRDAEGSVLSLKMSLNADQRRAIAEVVPTLPAYMGGGTARELVDVLQTIELEINAAEEFVITLKGRPDKIEQWLTSMRASVPEQVEGSPSVHSVLQKYFMHKVLAQPPQRAGDALTWKVSLAEALESDLGTTLGLALLAAEEKIATNRMRQLLLAMHNYDSAYRKLPEINTNRGKPRLLSWRVDVLPFMDNDLWKEFHHDEPWDSPHNKQLIPRMPEVFRSPQSKHDVNSGLSTYVLPVHEKTFWSKDREPSFSDARDGTSNTIMVAEVRDELAQVWTKPEPFEINLGAVETQLGGHFKDKVLVGLADGSWNWLTPEELHLLPALLTRDGGEVIKW